MTTFNPNIPQPDDDLDISQPVLLTNNQALDSIFGIDHYAFSNTSANSGFHNTATFPIISGSAHPTTASGITKIYAMQDSVNIGLINYSRGPSDSVPTPLTSIQSSSTPSSINGTSTLQIFNFAGLTNRAIAVLSAVDYETINSLAFPSVFSIIKWNGTSLVSTDIQNSALFQSLASGTNLLLSNLSLSNMTQVFWTLKFLRIQ